MKKSRMHIIKSLAKQLAALGRNTFYVRRYTHSRIRKDVLLLESKHGEDVGGNIFYLLRELSARKKYRLYLVLKKEKRAQICTWLSTEHITNVRMIEPGTLRYYRLLATAGYLWTDTSFPPRYIKKKGQIVVNTWHGTPMKAMGQDDRSEGWSMGNIQRNLFLADYLLFPNALTESVMLDAYGLRALYRGRILREEYPRNTVLTDPDVRAAMRKALDLEEKELFVYMPTWRGRSTEKATLEREQIERFLRTMEQTLDDRQVLYVKFHPFVKESLSLSEYRHIRFFPGEWETYRVLAAADVLLTDYSSVLFDFMNTGRPILLYAYDEDAYAAERGFCLRPEELGLPIARTAEELPALLEKKAPIPASLFETYCPHESRNAAGRVVDAVMDPLPSEGASDDSAAVPTALFFAGEWLKNGITTAAQNILKEVGTQETVYYVAFDQGKLRSEPEALRSLPPQIRWFPMSGGRQYTFGDMLWLGLSYALHPSNAWLQRRTERFFIRERDRLFPGLTFTTTIQFEGYGRTVTQLWQTLPGRKVIFVHNNMQRELQQKKNQDPMVLRRAYQTYDRVAIVTEDLREATIAVGADPARIRVVNNLLDAQSVRRRAEEAIVYDEDTQASLSCADLENLLRGPSVKMVTVGRFSAEKGHDQLIRAFEGFHAKHPDSDLILIGGYGALYEETCRLARASSAAAHIHWIRSLKNPMPIVRRCNLFLLSSHYEGQGLTLLEADALGLPTVSTEVCGPTGIMKRYGGYLVPDSPEGLYAGMEAYLRGEVRPMAIDFDAYNREAVRQYRTVWDAPTLEKNL